MLSNQNLDGEKSNPSSFKKARAFFEKNELKNAIKEFYEVQRNFHKHMSDMVQAFSSIKSQLPERSKYLLDELLIPYNILSKNVFREPSGDTEKDILHIMQVINKQNEEFKKALTAFLNSISNFETFNTLLNQYAQDEEFVRKLKELLNNESWLNVQGYVGIPFQNLMRYESLIQTLKKHLVENGCATTEPVFEHTNNSLNYIVPEIQNINENRETILQLNKIHRMLLELLADEIVKEESTIHISKQEENNNNHSNQLPTLRQRIEFALITTKTGKDKVIAGEADIESLFQGLFDILKDLDEAYNKTEITSSLSKAAQYLTSSGYQLLSNSLSFFGLKEKPKINYLEPREELKQIIQDTDIFLGQLDSLRRVEEFWRSRKQN